ncbi:hypothetical protein [Sphingosinicella sp. BN140058]|uniref:hypothetical protein n=1 Tax=Sphingosinicella sp. BN140058 TaxID=1892855 RepID=UPI001010949A|nr:hypothetical protein [Sphingosinicella sp. BN140058]QAY80402.1 hypothetical protein ETR14_27565 [Sphingosinicella sp. BN140058]
MEELLTVWVIYHRPADVPGVEYVLRAQTANRDRTITVHPEAWTGSTLDEVRGKLERIQPGLVRLDRAPEDEPHVVETWI